MTKPFKRLLLLLFAFMILFLIWLFLDHGNHGPPTVSRQTTYETDEAFVMENGYIDYYGVLNKHFFDPVDPKDNGGIKVVEAIGPKREVDFDIYWRIITRGKMEQPKGPYYRPFDAFFDQEKDPDAFSSETLSQLFTRPWNAEEFPEGKAWLEANQRALELSQEAAEAKAFSLPLYSANPESDSLIAALLVYSQEVRTLARLLIAQAMYELGRGEMEKCQNCILSTRSLASQIAGNGTLVEQLVGVALLSMAQEAEVQMLNSNKLTMEQAEEYQNKFYGIKAFPGIQKTIDKSERLMGLSAAQSIHQHGTSGLGENSSIPIGPFDIDVVMKELNQEYDQLAERLKIEDYPSRSKKLNEWEGELDRMAEDTTVTNWVLSMPTRKGRSRMASRMMLGLLMPAIIPVDRAHVRGVVMTQLTPIAMELEKRYIADGKFPDSLDVIANEMSKRDANWNIDPFTGKSFFYKKEKNGYRLYSLGANGVDNKGEFSNGIDQDDTGIHRQLEKSKSEK